MPTTLAIIVATFSDLRERNMAIGIWAAAGALALATGPVPGMTERDPGLARS
jgi:MFS transporter, DHA2 family, multidrug resistance protein